MKTGPWTHASYSKNGEKAIQCGFRLAKQQVCTTYLTFSLPSLHDYHMKLFHVLWMTQYEWIFFFYLSELLAARPTCHHNLFLAFLSKMSLNFVLRAANLLIRVFPFQLISWFYVFKNSLIIHKEKTKDMATLFLCPIL